jgi:hypothetical protein
MMRRRKHFSHPNPHYPTCNLRFGISKPIPASKPAPSKEDFDYIVKTKGFDEAISIAKNTIKNDTLTDLYTWYVFNGMGYGFLNEKKYKEAISIFKLNTELPS